MPNKYYRGLRNSMHDTKYKFQFTAMNLKINENKNIIDGIKNDVSQFNNSLEEISNNENAISNNLTKNDNELNINNVILAQ